MIIENNKTCMEEKQMMTDAELIQEIRKYRCSDLSDGMDAIGLVDKGTMNEAMRPLRPGIEFKGLLPLSHYHIQD